MLDKSKISEQIYVTVASVGLLPAEQAKETLCRFPEEQLQGLRHNCGMLGSNRIKLAAVKWRMVHSPCAKALGDKVLLDLRPPTVFLYKRIFVPRLKLSMFNGWIV